MFKRNLIDGFGLINLINSRLFNKICEDNPKSNKLTKTYFKPTKSKLYFDPINLIYDYNNVNKTTVFDFFYFAILFLNN